MGITKFASHQLGDVVYVEIPQANLVLAKGDTMGAVESVNLPPSSPLSHSHLAHHPAPLLNLGKSPPSDMCGRRKQVKTASDILAPVSGTILSSNEKLEEKPGLVNKDPEGEDGWIAKIELDATKCIEELDELMDAEAYEKFVAE